MISSCVRAISWYSPAFLDAKAVTKHQLPLILYIKLLKVLHCGFEFSIDSNMLV